MTVALGLMVVCLALYLIVRLALAARAVSRARGAIAKLSEELAAAHSRSAERYRVPLPGRKDYEDELSVSDAMLAHLQGKLANLANRPLSEKLLPSFVTACNQVTFGAVKKVNDLQDEVFWAQFPLNSDARKARYRDNTDD